VSAANSHNAARPYEFSPADAGDGAIDRIGTDAVANPEGERPASGALVDTADIPGGGILHLVSYGGDYEILFGDEQLMGSWASGSEEALATLVCGRIPEDARILIGGLGMGFTLAAALGAMPPKATVVVAELVPKIVEWARGPLAHLFGNRLSDPRVSLEIRDVHNVIDEAVGRFDAILLDVDNGPDGLINLANERLYCNWGLRAARRALRPGGVLAIWSAYSDDAFRDRLAAAGFAVEEFSMDADGGQQHPHHYIWIATRQD
jgi:spermidine synthase